MRGRRLARNEDRNLCFEVGKHRLCLERRPDGWAVSVDGLARGARFGSQAEAWEAGVRMALSFESSVTPLPDQASQVPGRSYDSPPEPGIAGSVDG
jgi:hypothetical protein